MVKKYIKENYLIFSIAIVIILVYIYRINVMKTPYFSDEVGYWAAGAWMNNIDWSPIYSHSAYYGWGYGIILAPLFCINDGALRFQIAILLNILLILGCYLLLISINKRLFSHVKVSDISIISGVAVLYSYNIIYAHTTMCEVCLTFLFLLSLRILLDIFKKINLRNILFFVIVISLQLATHLRTIVFIFALTILVLYLVYCKKIHMRYVLIIGALIIGGIVFVMAIKDRLVLSQYSMQSSNIVVNVDRTSVNDSFMKRFSILKNFIVLDTWERLFYSIIGKAFYLGCASFLLIYIGIRYFVKNIWLSFRVNKELDKNNCVYLYIVLAFLGAFFLSAITLMYAVRYDHIFYGRYIENVVPIIICAGLIEIFTKNVKLKQINLYILGLILMAFILQYAMHKYPSSGALPLETSGFAGIMSRDKLNYNAQFAVYAIAVMLLIMIPIYYIVKKNMYIACILIAIAWSIMAYRGLEICAYPELNRQEQIICAADELDKLEGKIWTIVPSERYITAYVDTLWLQFHLGKRTMYEINEDNLSSLDENDIFVISKSYPNMQDIIKGYSVVWENDKICIIKR